MVRQMVLALLSGTLFGAGLTVGGMTDPARVIGFLDVTGKWDATLAFVMGGALIVMAAAWAVRSRLQRPLVAETFAVPANRAIDRRLAIGALLFGIGWGLAGICPGPAIATFALAPGAILPFVAAMAAGMILARMARLA